MSCPTATSRELIGSINTRFKKADCARSNMSQYLSPQIGIQFLRVLVTRAPNKYIRDDHGGPIVFFISGVSAPLACFAFSDARYDISLKNQLSN